ncbi:hypothetical protein ACFFQF_11215 [Haladaptatus pallidirubidus]|uniref:hypothetical protein n=1 Tax=Haladaptatus pallidirubidus TaxID=1008152 RepID=UPI0035E6947F
MTMRPTTPTLESRGELPNTSSATPTESTANSASSSGFPTARTSSMLSALETPRRRFGARAW